MRNRPRGLKQLAALVPRWAWGVLVVVVALDVVFGAYWLVTR